MCQRDDQSLVGKTYTQLALKRSHNEFCLCALTRRQQLIDDSDFLVLGLHKVSSTPDYESQSTLTALPVALAISVRL
jgi:hypothetical protein